MEDKSCFNCAYFPNCKILNSTYSENDTDEDRIAFLNAYGKACKYYYRRYI